MVSTVAVVRTTPETVIDDYARVIKLAGCKLTKDVILKLNLSWSLYYPACSSQPWQVEGVVKALCKKHNVIPVENHTVVTDVWKGARDNLWLPILEKYGLTYQPLTEVEWVPFKPKAKLRALQRVFPEGLRVPKLFKGKSIVHLPTVKTHGHTMMTGAMKNAFGGLIDARRHHCHKHIHEVLVDLLHIQKELHPKIFAVMDGTVIGDGAGPRTMIPRTGNILLASHDQVAIDAVSAKLMGFDPMRIPFLRMAHEDGLGCADVSKIRMVGDDVSDINFHCKTRKSPVIFFDQMFRNHSHAIERWLFHTGLFHACVLGSGWYHDKVWYPLVGRHRIRKFMGTEWGRLWGLYAGRQ